ncbi:MAG TPA: hypothetical protein PKM21_08320 [Anaerolineales bacterium]|nr:hypothetical protein [Anaerolineales bacterium]
MTPYISEKRSLQNPHLRLDYLATAGPRLVGLYVDGKPANLLAENINVGWDTPYGTYNMLGGHRLWAAPENPAYTAIPDGEGLELSADAAHARLCQPPSAASGLRRTIEVTLDPEQPVVHLKHTLANEGSASQRVALWPITQFPMGGLALIPQPVGPSDPHGLQPNRSLILWPYTRLNDPRLHLRDNYVLLEATPDTQACKVGHFNQAGWLAYFWQGMLFCKYFAQPQPALPYPDLGCNAEVYVRDIFLELESLSPLSDLAPGTSITHDERWVIYPAAERPKSEIEIQSWIERLNAGK